MTHPGWHNYVYWLVGVSAFFFLFGTLFVVRDFIQWNVHRVLHRVPWLWEFHKVHHSVEEMGFAAHLRYHWMENVVYNALQYVPLAMIGFGIDDFFVVYVTTDETSTWDSRAMRTFPRRSSPRTCTASNGRRRCRRTYPEGLRRGPAIAISALPRRC